MLIAGLGNPGLKYAYTRHNAGFMVVDHIIKKYNLSGPIKKFNSEFFEGEISGRKIYAIKPLTFMNNSGEAVRKAADFFKISSENLLVIHDELHLPFGKVRVKIGGGDGGHNGIKSIDAHLGKDYKRLRIGINDVETEDKMPYVLGNFSKQEKADLEELLDEIAEYLPILLEGEDSLFMNKIDIVTKKILRNE